MNKIIVDDGLKTYTIENKRGDYLGEFTFNPSDTNIITRHEEVIEFINNLTLPENEDKESIKETEKLLKEKIDYLLNADTSQTFFKICGPLTPLVSGETFVENIIAAIGTVIEKEMGVRMKKANERINKYTQKYKK